MREDHGLGVYLFHQDTQRGHCAKHTPSKKEQGKWEMSGGDHTEPSAQLHSLSSSFSFMFCCSSIHLLKTFTEHLLNTYNVPQTALGTGYVFIA